MTRQESLTVRNDYNRLYPNVAPFKSHCWALEASDFPAFSDSVESQSPPALTRQRHPRLVTARTDTLPCRHR